MASEGYGRAESESSGTEEKVREQPDLLKQGGGGWQVTSNRPGALDFLPDVREGDITLLNTKAELFSPFVRRVAVRVFGHLVILLRRQLEGVSTTTTSAASDGPAFETVIWYSSGRPAVATSGTAILSTVSSATESTPVRLLSKLSLVSSS